MSKIFNYRKEKTVSQTPKSRGSFIEKTLHSLIRKMERAIFAEEAARSSSGLLQKLDPRVKIIGLFALILSTTLARNLLTIVLIFGVAIMLAAWSNISLRTLAKRAWLGVLAFTGVIAFPAVFTTPGEVLWRIPWLDWIITWQGLTSATFLILRGETTVTLSILLVLSTLWVHILKALRVLGTPVVFVVILGMTYRYLFVMLETAQNFFEARQSRLVGTLEPRDSRRLVAASIGVLLAKSFQLNAEVYLAMQSRGFRGEVYTLDEFAMQPRDWLALTFFLAAAVISFWLGLQSSGSARFLF